MTKQAPGEAPERKAFVKAVATFFGIGCLPWAPGTMGSLAGILIAWFAGPFSNIFLLFFILLGFMVSKPAAKVLGSSDPSSFVMDEVCGMMLTLFLIPRNFYLFLAGFILFRFFDIVKPWPISVIQRSKHPWAIMGDDLLAGLFANSLIHAYLILRLFF